MLTVKNLLNNVLVFLRKLYDGDYNDKYENLENFSSGKQVRKELITEYFQ